MARFNKDVELKYGIDTYEETKQTYEWIEKSAKKWGGKEATLSLKFNFHLGDISCTAESIQEFSEIAYGASDYRLTSFHGSIYAGEQRIGLNYLMSLTVFAENRVDLESFLNALEKTSLDVPEEATATHIETQINIENQNNGIVVQGENNTVVTSSSNVSLNTSKKESKLKSWLVSIGQNILSNGIWYLLTAAIAALITYFSTKG